jgi:hypothetical protein
MSAFGGKADIGLASLQCPHHRRDLSRISAPPILLGLAVTAGDFGFLTLRLAQEAEGPGGLTFST